MREGNTGHTRREILKLTGLALISPPFAHASPRENDSGQPSTSVPPSPVAKTVHDLSSQPWILAGCVTYFDELPRSADIRKMEFIETGPVPATVPGSVQMALLNAGLIKDWNIGLNARDDEWVENRDWIFQVAIPDEWIKDAREVRLRCAGLDYSGELWLNGHVVGTFENTFLPHFADLKPQLKPTGNTLAIRFLPPPRWLGQAGYTSRMKEWKSRFYYTWDWISRVVQTGIWGGVYLEVTSGAEIESLKCHTDAELGSGKGILRLGGRVKGGDRVRVALSGHHGQVRQQELFVSEFNTVGIEWAGLPIDLWWPNKMGLQPLYEVTCELLDSDGKLIDRQVRRVGFRHIEWKRTKGAAETADPYLCVVNGKEVFLCGVDWTPIRPNFADLREADYRQRLELYRDLGVTILRVWGGGFPEKDDLFNLCDELGILIWQEFPLSSSGIDNCPPDDIASIDALANIATSYIERLQNHAALLLWCGGNELMDDKNGVPSAQPTFTIKNHPMVVRLGQVVAREDPGRRFLPTSPFGPVGNFAFKDCGKGVYWDVHGPWNLDGPVEGSWKQLWDKDDAMFHSEMGAPAASSVALIRKYKGDLPDMPGTKQNPLWNRQSWWIDWPKFVAEKGREPRDLEEYVEWSQARQTAALTLAAKEIKSRFPACGGMIIWMGHDSFPCTSNTSIVDFDGNPKPAAIALGKIFRS